MMEPRLLWNANGKETLTKLSNTIIFNDLERPLTQLKVTPFFDYEYLSNGTRYILQWNTHRDLDTPY